MLKTNVPISGSCITMLPIAAMKLIYQLGISLALWFPSWGKFIWNNLQEDHKDRRLGSDYVQIRFAHRAPLGLPLLHDSIITPTLKYQAAAVGSRRKESHTGAYMNRMCMYSCCETNFFSMIHQQNLRTIVSRGKYLISRGFLLLAWICSHCSVPREVSFWQDLIMRAGNKHDPNMLHSWCKLILCIAKHHLGYLKKHVCVV